MRILKLILTVLFIGISIASCEDILEVPDISAQQVEIVAPKDSTIVAQTQVNFTWNGVSNADAYLIQIAKPNFKEASQIVLDSTIVLDSAFVGTRAIKMLENGDYEWRVKALNSDFQTGFSTSVFKVEASSN